MFLMNGVWGVEGMYRRNPCSHFFKSPVLQTIVFSCFRDLNDSILYILLYPKTPVLEFDL